MNFPLKLNPHVFTTGFPYFFSDQRWDRRWDRRWSQHFKRLRQNPGYADLRDLRRSPLAMPVTCGDCCCSKDCNGEERWIREFFQLCLSILIEYWSLGNINIANNICSIWYHYHMINFSQYLSMFIWYHLVIWYCYLEYFFTMIPGDNKNAVPRLGTLSIYWDPYCGKCMQMCLV